MRAQAALAAQDLKVYRKQDTVMGETASGYKGSLGCGCVFN